MWITTLKDPITVQFFDGTTPVAEFRNEDIIELLKHDGQYKKDNGSYWAFINFVCTGSNKFTSVRISGQTVYTDNHTIGFKTDMNMEVSVEGLRQYTTTKTGYTLGVEDFDKAAKAIGSSNFTLASTFKGVAQATYKGEARISTWDDAGKDLLSILVVSFRLNV